MDGLQNETISMYFSSFFLLFKIFVTLLTMKLKPNARQLSFSNQEYNFCTSLSNLE